MLITWVVESSSSSFVSLYEPLCCNSTCVGGPTLQLLYTYPDRSDWAAIGVHGL
jgi:hypothetical protein